jgi:rhamnose transport system permease protein
MRLAVARGRRRDARGRPGRAAPPRAGGVFVLTLLFFASVVENYLGPRLFNRISTSVAIVTVIAVGQAFVVLTRNIDLSVGSVVGCTAYFLGGLLSVAPWIPAPLVPVVALLMGRRSGR